MKNLTLMKILSILSVSLLVLSFAAAAWSADDKAGTKVLAKIGDRVITEADLMERLDAISPLYRASMDKEGGKQAFLKKLVYLYIFAQEARAEKVDQDKTVKMKLEDMANGVLAKEYMKKKGLTSPEVTKEEVEKYYRAHAGEFTKGTQVKVSEILVKMDSATTGEKRRAAREKAQKIADEAKKGADFAKLAMKYSDDEKTAPKGGSLGYLAKDQMPVEMAKVAFSMKEGDVSNPIQTPQGFFVIKVDGKKEGGQETLDDAKKRIVPLLVKEKERELVDAETRRLEKKYNVKFFVEDAAKKTEKGKKQ